jgi:hypothetical protein
MPDITVAADEVAATELVHDAETALGILSDAGSGGLGPFTASWNVSIFFSDGSVDLISPDVIRIADCEMHYNLDFDFPIDLNDFLPAFCLPRVCIPNPFDGGELCTPEICIDWPTIGPVPINYSDVLTFTADFGLDVHLDGADWLVDIVIVDIPSLEIGAAAAAILASIGVAVGPFLLAVPFIGPFLALASAAILAAIGIAGVTGLLGPILTPFVSGLTFTVYEQPQLFEVLPAALPLDPAVNINLDAITAAVVASDEDELVLTVDFSPL